MTKRLHFTCNPAVHELVLRFINAGIQLGLPQSDVLAIAATVELLHNASLVHDDLQDGDAYRRGHMAVWKNLARLVRFALVTL